MSEPVIPAPSPARQIGFHQLLVAARKNWLTDALKKALKAVPQKLVKEQLAAYVPADVQQVLATAGIRDEHIFPVPAVLEAKPTLIGYYRLLLGIPQKTFYKSGSRMGQFKTMESRGLLPKRRPDLEGFCTAMGQSLSELVRQMSPQISHRDVGELPLLALGSQFQGSKNNAIGKQATVDVFLSISELLKPHIQSENSVSISIRNASGRKVVVALASDPDIRIQEEFEPGSLRNKVAIEIKGGTDYSNVHNRAGEAEKSHQKAKNQGFRDFWTLISKSGVNMEKLTPESPTTNSWFDVAQVLARDGADWKEFSSRFAEAAGIPLPPDQT
ncbi:MAG TPA: XcyI family restriction endonuclease [Terracidiphilus sp.]|nr:XcyI family restriction endonuclease [Terracidiphilus sp.]